MKSFTYAFRGIADAIKSEPNLRIHFAFALATFVFAFYLNFSFLEWAVLILTIFLVFSLELINTVVEKVVDIASPQISEKARVAKDISAAVVLLGATASVLIGLCLFLPKIGVLL